MIENELKGWLSTNIALAGQRIWAVKLPQNPVLPALTFFKVSGVPVHTHQGNSGLPTDRFQVSCWDDDYPGAKALAAEVKTDLDCYKGLMGAVDVGACLLVGERDLHDPDTDRWQVALDFQITYA